MDAIPLFPPFTYCLTRDGTLPGAVSQSSEQEVAFCDLDTLTDHNMPLEVRHSVDAPGSMVIRLLSKVGVIIWKALLERGGLSYRASVVPKGGTRVIQVDPGLDPLQFISDLPFATVDVRITAGVDNVAVIRSRDEWEEWLDVAAMASLWSRCKSTDAPLVVRLEGVVVAETAYPRLHAAFSSFVASLTGRTEQEPSVEGTAYEKPASAISLTQYIKSVQLALLRTSPITPVVDRLGILGLIVAVSAELQEFQRGSVMYNTLSGIRESLVRIYSDPRVNPSGVSPWTLVKTFLKENQ
jgi:hypothetical protein